MLVSSLTRVHQNSYDALFRGATSSQNYYSVEQQSLTALQSALGSPEGGAAAADVPNFATGGVTMLMFETTAL